MMRKWILALFICITVFRLWAQGNYYIYIQSEDNKPFYVKYGSSVFASSGDGDVIIPNLSGGSCAFLVGFPERAGVEWKFECNTSETDQVYILRTSNSKSVELSVLNQGKNIAGTKVETAPSKQTIAQEKKATGVVSNDTFSSMLAQVVNDPSIRQQPLIIPKPGDSLNLAKTLKKDSANASVAIVDKQPELKKEEKPVVKKDSLVAAAKTNKDSINTLVASVDKKEEIKKEEKLLKPDSSAIVKVANKDSINTMIAAADKKPTLKEDEKISEKIDSSAVVKADKKDSAHAIIAAADKKTALEKEEKITAKADSSVVKKDSTIALIAAADKKAEQKKEEKPAIKPDSSITVKPTKKDTVNALVASVAKKEEKASAKTDSSAIVTTVKKAADSVALIVADKKPEIKKDEKIITKADSNVIAKTTAPVTKQDNNTTKPQLPAIDAQPGKWVPVEKKSIVRSSNIKKTLQRKSNDGIELIYIDELTDGTKDTIRILIPATP
ncbi:MAG: hypothetical protein IT249_00400 [Chitinophagaceae bacterium]|nr:hypothetical protein [Chitinophagaceae bacterium]